MELASVFPFVWRRAWALVAALAAVAFGLFALRYLVTSSLSLKQALIPMQFNFPAEIFERMASSGRQKDDSRRATVTADKLGLRQGDGPKQEDLSALSKNPASPGLTKSSEANGETGAQQPGTARGQVQKEPEAGDAAQKSEQRRASSKDGQQANNAADSSRGNRPSDDKEAQENREGRPPSNLMDRMKDALSSLLAKMQPQRGTQRAGTRDGGKQESKAEQQAPEDYLRDSQTGQNNRDSQGSRAQDQQKNAQSQSESEASEKSPGTQSRTPDQSASKKGSDSHSGIGRQDGEKSLKEAEQLRALGKLDEIIGKRSANLTGDMTVETNSSRQQLQTQYSGRVGQHADLGGEIDRTEVPVALQKYVREYMEQVRKQANEQP